MLCHIGIFLRNEKPKNYLVQVRPALQAYRCFFHCSIWTLPNESRLLVRHAKIEIFSAELCIKVCRSITSDYQLDGKGPVRASAIGGRQCRPWKSIERLRWHPRHSKGQPSVQINMAAAMGLSPRLNATRVKFTKTSIWKAISCIQLCLPRCVSQSGNPEQRRHARARALLVWNTGDRNNAPTR